MGTDVNCDRAEHAAFFAEATGVSMNCAATARVVGGGGGFYKLGVLFASPSNKDHKRLESMLEPPIHGTPSWRQHALE